MREREEEATRAVHIEFGIEADYNGVPELVREVVRLREALAAATRVRVLDHESANGHLPTHAVIGRNGRVLTSVEDPDENTENWWDRHNRKNAPHRVVRVALVDQNHPEMPESSTRVTEGPRDQ
jgi:hypothetical protein